MYISHKRPRNHLPAFTMVELLITISLIAVLAGIVTFAATSIQKNSRDTARDAQVRILSTSLEKYYRENGEYPSVAAMTTNDVDTLKKKLDITDSSIFALPTSTTANSIASANPSPTTLVYSANTTDTTKNSQCQTDANGYCDGYTLAYTKEANGSVATIQSLHATFAAVHDSSVCDTGDTQSGTTCTHTYAGTYNAGAYSCPSGGSLSGTTCTNTYAASYSSGGGYYYCPSGGNVSGSNCVTSSSYAASSSTGYSCGSGTSVSGANYPLCRSTYSASSTTSYSCPHANDSVYNTSSCYHTRTSYTTSASCLAAGYYWGSYCFNVHAADAGPTTYSCPSGGYLSGTQCVNEYDGTPVTTYSCPSGGSLSGTTCTTSSSYAATYYSYPGGYYCSGSGTLSGTTCTNSYTATQGSGYYTCPQGGTASGSNCSYTYELQG